MDLASLQLEIDSRQIKEGKRALDDFAASAEKTEQATESLASASRNQAREYTRMVSVEHQARQANERQAAAMKAAAETAEQNRLSLGKLLGQIDPIK